MKTKRWAVGDGIDIHLSEEEAFQWSRNRRAEVRADAREEMRRAGVTKARVFVSSSKGWRRAGSIAVGVSRAKTVGRAGHFA